MFAKVLVANRGAIAVQGPTTSWVLGGSGVSVGVPQLGAPGSSPTRATGSARWGTRSRPPCTLVWRPPHVVPFIRGS
jgi:hypothetical protein